ncbi:thermonuclease family protein [Patescibacteria group bacterium]|nr:thermonuclease family protein [Patescibacteria group bacterium]
MWSNTKLLVIACFLIIILGFSLLWFSLKLPANPVIVPTSTNAPLAESLPTATASAYTNGEQALVTKVIDGDTIELADGRRVRFIGIDTPETVDPRRPVGCFGKEASNETKSLLTGKVVIMQKDVSETDKYNRILRLIYLPLDNGQKLFVNDYLVREGFAKVSTYPPDVKFADQFLEAERQARENNRGLWKKCK